MISINLKGVFRNSLFWRIALLLLAIFVTLGMLYTLLTISVARMYSDETTQKLNENVAAHMLQHVKPFVDGKVDEQSLFKIMNSMMAVNPGLEVYIVDTTGSILSSVVLHQKISAGQVSIRAIKRFLRPNRPAVVYGDDPRNPGRRKIFSAAPVIENGVLQGYVYMILASRQYDTITAALRESYLLKIGVRAFMLALVATFIISLFLLWLLMRSLRDVIHTVERFSTGDFSPRISVRRNGEIQRLSRTINSMADTIVRNIETLKETDSLRRDLIANISHDIRTPISVIHGYAETLIIKQSKLDETKRNEYLATILRSTEKLKRLVNDLFELSKLQSKQIKPNVKVFYISDIIRELLLKYQLVAQEKMIQLEAEFLAENELVQADATMIERVLQNLIDNAIQYSVKNEKVKISVESNSNKVFVSITNHGREIPADKIQRIFERYYKIEQSNENQGTGLGLAIVKNILELLGSDISVKSENLTTTFSFHLPAG